MTTTKHLQLIKKECERLLALSEKRTQGEWRTKITSQKHHSLLIRGTDSRSEMVSSTLLDNGDAAYIAACAGRAEAGWKSTIAAIDAIITEVHVFGIISLNENIVKDILAAWPIELLTKQ